MNIEERISGIELIAYLAALLGLFVLLQWHDNYTNERIAEAEAQQVKTVDCGPAVVATK